MTSWLLKSGNVFTNGQITKRDIKVEDGVIVEVAENLDNHYGTVIDCSDLLITPGLIDVHIHLREPGGEHKETIETGTAAAARGGFTTVAAMPNTSPVPDCPEVLNDINDTINRKASVRVLPYASITEKLQGGALTNIESLAETGAFAFTDDGVGIQQAGMMLEAMKRAARLNKAVVAHCEDNSLTNNGVVHDGAFAHEHAINGIPNVCESVQIARDVLLAEAAGAHYHVCHVSTRESVRVIRDAKRAGINVTAEVTPHHLLLTEDDISGLDTNYKMNPPLRSKEDQEALIEGVMDGTIDIIATDHAPHAEHEKAQPITEAPFGIVGLETAFPLLYTHLVKTEKLTLEGLLERLTTEPARVFDINGGELTVGAAADIAVFNLQQTQNVDPDGFASKGRNTPFKNWELSGWPTLTMVGGHIVWDKGSVMV